MAGSSWTPKMMEYTPGYSKHYAVIGGNNTLNTWHLVPNSRLVVSLPEQKKQIIDVPGGNGAIDLSMSLSKYPLFNRRTGTLSFTVLPDYDYEEIRNSMANAIHGQKCNLVLSEDPDFYYTGYFSVVWNSNEDGSAPTVDIEYDLEPYKTANTLTYIDNLFTTPSVQQGNSPLTITNSISTPTATLNGNTLPNTYPTPLIVTVSNATSTAACDILFGNTYLGITIPNLNETNSAGQVISHYQVNKNGTFGISQYPISFRGTSSDKIYIKVNNTNSFMPNNQSMNLVFSYRRKLL